MELKKIKSLNRRGAQAGFTLIELLLVMVIIAILAAVVVPKFTGRTEQANTTRAIADISSFKTALGMFETDNGRYPTSEEGLKALNEKPSGELPSWKQYMSEKIPMDPWGHEYIYRCPGNNNSDFDLLSLGKDGTEGSADDVPIPAQK